MRQESAPRHFGAEDGFTLVELAVSVGLIGIVLVVATSTVSFFTRNNAQMTRTTSNAAEQRSFEASFVDVAKTAGAAVQFQHLPVLVNCGGSTTVPCVRTWNATTSRFVENATAITNMPVGTFIEFFRDEDASSLTVQTQPFGSGTTAATNNAVLQSSPGFVLSTPNYTGDFYTTWPLVTDASPPFYVLQTVGSNTFTLDWGTTAGAAQNVIAPTGNSRWIASNPTEVAEQLDFYNQNVYLAMYNAKDPRQFVIQWLSSIALTGASPLYYSIGLTPFPLTPAWASGSGDFGTESGSYPTLASFSAGTAGTWGGAGTNWNPYGNSAFYLLPTEISSLSCTPSPCGLAADAFAAPVDIRKVAYYLSQVYNDVNGTTGSQPAIVGQPLAGTLYFLRKAVVPDGCPPNYVRPPTGCPTAQNYSLVAAVYPSNNKKTTVIKDIPTGQRVVFARRLGSNNLEVYRY